MILVTGGAGYIGSHTCVKLIEAGYGVVVMDNLSNGKYAALQRIEQITGYMPHFVEGDIRNNVLLDEVFRAYDIQAVVHFAGLKSVNESVQMPLEYYDNNVQGTLCLLTAMKKAGVKQIVFSSSATVYGHPAKLPVQEGFPLSATNAYGRSKLIIEEMLGDLYRSDNEWRIACLRYFNPVGAHPSGLIGEDPRGIPNNLLPYVSQVAVGRREKLSVYGGDYPTVDGTGVRDFIHVVDLAMGHVKALETLAKQDGMFTVNLGTGNGYSVLQVVAAFEKACGRTIPYSIVGRRDGDVAECWADPAMAQVLMGWKAEHNIEQMCEDAWRWQQMNPAGLPG